MAHNDVNLSNFSTTDHTLLSILADEDQEQPWRMSDDVVDKILPRRSSVHLNFLKNTGSVREITECNESTKHNEDIDFTFEEGDTSYFIHPSSVREQYGSTSRSPSSNVEGNLGYNEKHSSAFVPYSKNSSVQDQSENSDSSEDHVFYKKQKIDDIMQDPESNKCNNAKYAQAPLKFANLEKERRRERSTKLKDGRGVKEDNIQSLSQGEL